MVRTAHPTLLPCFLKQQHEIPQNILEKEASYYAEVLKHVEPPVTIGEQKIMAEVVRY
jgi:hypothetical protein